MEMWKRKDDLYLLILGVGRNAISINKLGELEGDVSLGTTRVGYRGFHSKEQKFKWSCQNFRVEGLWESIGFKFPAEFRTPFYTIPNRSVNLGIWLGIPSLYWIKTYSSVTCTQNFHFYLLEQQWTKLLHVIIIQIWQSLDPPFNSGFWRITILCSFKYSSLT